LMVHVNVLLVFMEIVVKPIAIQEVGVRIVWRNVGVELGLLHALQSLGNVTVSRDTSEMFANLLVLRVFTEKIAVKNVESVEIVRFVIQSR
jgi:hypothetical protein